MKKITILSGAGISAESGVQTFRDAGGLWEGHDIMEVASPEGWRSNPKIVLDFYNKRRAQLLSVLPNAGHIGLAQLEKNFEVKIITQNVDDLHEKAGSKEVMHLHGELLKVRCTCDASDILDWHKDLNIGDLSRRGCQLRPHIVWFGEEVPLLTNAIEWVSQSDVLVVIGTSLQVYPAASLLQFVKANTPIILIDPQPTISEFNYNHLSIIKEKAVSGVAKLQKILLDKYFG